MSDKKSGDFLLKFLVTVLVIFGVIMVFSASSYTALNEEGDAYAYLRRDALWAFFGFIAMYIISKIPYKFYMKLAVPLILISFGLLVAVLFIGTEINNATRWIIVGPITIMPGEIAKPCVAIFAAWYFSKNPNIIKSFKVGVFPMIILMGAFGGLIMLQPNMSTAITVVMIIACIMFAAGMKASHIAVLGAGGVVAGIGLAIYEPYRLERVMNFWNPFLDPGDTGYQVVQSLLAIGSGGIFGVGLGRSVQKTLYLPEPQNDFIFAIIGEELGFVGAGLLILCYMLLIWRGIHIAINCKDLFGFLLATGITATVALQVIMNIAVATASMPPTGIALPFISWGGNSLVLFMASMGILINISKRRS